MQTDLFAVVDNSGGAPALPFVVVEYACVPRGKGRPRGRLVIPKGAWSWLHGLKVLTEAAARQIFITFYTDSETESYEKALAWRAKGAMKGKPPETGPLAIRLFCMMPIAKSWPQRDKDAALAGTKFHMSTPDTDNLLKAVLDAFNGVIYADDKQVVRHYCHKEYGESPGIIAEVYRLP